MISIFAPTDLHQELEAIIALEDRLDELVNIHPLVEAEAALPNELNLRINDGYIYPVLTWSNLLPPYLLPEEIKFSEDNLLGLIFGLLGNYEKSQAYLKEKSPTLNLELDFINRLQQGIPIDPGELSSDYSPFDEYRLMHNQAVIRHYVPLKGTNGFDQTRYFYLQALEAAPDDEHRAFSAWQFAQLLTDLGESDDAARVARAGLGFALSEAGQNELRYILAQALMQKLAPPYDEDLLTEIKELLWKVLQAFEKSDHSLARALVLKDAGMIANYSESWAESLGYFNQALELLKDEELPELTAEVHYRKGDLLFSWAKSGNPQFFRPAAESYQQAILVFTREQAPAVYAEIQQRLGMIYAEIPDDVKKKNIWAAVSSSAFQEALEIFTPEDYPYEFATVCNHYANALTQYPAARLSDNFQKALEYYQKALEIRQADRYPLERCLTLLNYLEAQWQLGMPEDRFDPERYEDMRQKATEVMAITPDPKLSAEAQDHLERLSYLKKAYEAE